MQPLTKRTADGILPSEPSIDALMGMAGLLGPSGWSKLETIAGGQLPPETANSDKDELRRAYVTVFFATPAGRMVLEDLLNRTLRRTSHHPGGKATLEEATVYGIHRGGENQTVVHILHMIQEGRDLPSPATTSTKKKGSK